jgi:hypothetical protein
MASVPLWLRLLLWLPATLLLAGAAAAVDTYIVCVVIESGFSMLRTGLAASVGEVRSDTQLRGFDVDMRALALSDVDYTVRVLPSYGELEVRTRSGECDIGWAQFFQLSSRMRCAVGSNTTSTCRSLDAAARAGDVQSWEPYRCCARYGPNLFPFEIRAMHIAPAQGDNNFFGSFFATVKSAFFINFLCFTFLVGCVFSHLVWICERHINNDEFPRAYFDGIDDGFWWAAVTFSTVGYGDKTPVTPAGRLFGVVWMIIGVTLSSILSGHMATSFYARRDGAAKLAINTVRDLGGRRVCGYSATFSSWYLPSDVDYTAVVRDNVKQCGALMQAGEVDVVVMEAPMMSYWMRNDPWAQTVELVLGPILAEVPMGVVYSDSSDIDSWLTLKLLELFESASVRDMQSRWFGPGGGQVGAARGGVEQIDWRLLGPSMAMLLVYSAGVVHQSVRRKENPCMTCVQQDKVGAAKDDECAVRVDQVHTQ